MRKIKRRRKKSGKIKKKELFSIYGTNRTGRDKSHVD